MALTISHVFPLGRFHATRWRQNPFEDRYGEWPPSPWRLLRSLAARWFQYARETGDDDTRKRDNLLRALAAELPAFQLPRATWRGQDLRQYHPTALEQQYKYKKNPTTKKNELDYSFRQVSTTLSLDTYRALGHCDRVVWIWRRIDLPGEQEQLLADLLQRIHYFGRAESFTSMQLAENRLEPNCVLCAEGSTTSVPVLAHSPDKTLDIDFLLSTSDDKRVSHRPHPPGTAWYQAELPPVPRRRLTQRRVTAQQKIQVVRYALDSPVLPLVTETLPVAEATRRALLGIYGRMTERDGVRGRSFAFSGKDENGTPAIGHRHAYYLPTDEDGDGRLDHITVVAQEGFDREERRAIDCLRTLKTCRKGEDRHPLRLLLLGMGTMDEYQPRPLKPSQRWESATPYLAARYAKTRGRHRIDPRSLQQKADFLQEDLRTQLQLSCPEIELAGCEIELIVEQNAFRIAQRHRPIEFRLFRQKNSDDGGRRLAGSFRLTFRTKVPGPICLGHSSHFGLGLFLPVD